MMSNVACAVAADNTLAPALYSISLKRYHTVSLVTINNYVTAVKYAQGWASSRLDSFS